MSILIDLIEGKKVPHTPVWIMRQAGRYLPEYRAIRKKFSFIDMCKNPEAASEVTLQPIDILDVDAAIIFSDILPPLMSMGLHLDYLEKKGPVINNAVSCLADIEKLILPNHEVEYRYLEEALQITRSKLRVDKTLIGFAGAPFTMASYAVEGGSSKNFSKTKSLMYNEPKAWDLLMNKLTEMTKKYLEVQLNSGAEIVQLFDSWAGALSPEDYVQYAHPYSKEIIRYIKEEVKKPIVHFAKGTGCYLDLVADSAADVIGIDWTITPENAAKLAKGKVLQGNLDPISLQAPKEILIEKVKSILAETAKLPNKHIFNLGHGVLPDTPVKNVKIVVDTVHSF